MDVTISTSTNRKQFYLAAFGTLAELKIFAQALLASPAMDTALEPLVTKAAKALEGT